MDGIALDVRTGSAFCGWSEKTTRGMIDRGLMPHRRLGGRIILIRAELETWLQALDGIGPEAALENVRARR